MAATVGFGVGDTVGVAVHVQEAVIGFRVGTTVGFGVGAIIGCGTGHRSGWEKQLVSDQLASDLEKQSVAELDTVRNGRSSW